MSDLLCTLGMIAIGLLLLLVAAVLALVYWAGKIDAYEQSLERESSERGWRR